MPMQQDCRVLSMRQISDKAYEMILQAGTQADSAAPGQFVNLACGEGHLLRRPISICQAKDGQLRLVFEVRGEGTLWLSQRRTGDTVNVLGPLGRGFDTAGKRVLLIGGGIGVPPLLWAGMSAASADAALGFADGSRAILLGDFAAACGKASVATDNGTLGIRGNAVTAARELMKTERYDLICACGPKVMLKAAAAAAEEAGIPCQVSMEERMGCGVGACLVCACALRNQQGEQHYGHVCKDGPVFDAKEVVFDE